MSSPLNSESFLQRYLAIWGNVEKVSFVLDDFAVLFKQVGKWDKTDLYH
jgi:hypothetical protein